MCPLTLGVVVADAPLSDRILACLKDLPVRVVLEKADTGDGAAIERDVRTFSPDVLLLDISQAAEGFPDLLRRLRALPSPPAILALADSGSPETILTAMRAGASDCLFPPIDELVLRQALDRVALDRSRQESQHASGKAIGFLASSGGCGATTLACHLAAELRRADAGQVLLADFDLVAGMAGFWLKAKDTYSILDAATNVERLDRSLWKALVSAVQPRMDVIGAPAEPPLGAAPTPDQLLAVLRFARATYEWTVADLGHSLTPVSMALLGDLDPLFLVTTPDVPALYQARRIVRKLHQVGCARDSVRLVLNRVHKQTTLVPGELEKLLSIPIAAVLPEDRSEVVTAQEEGGLIAPKSGLGQRIAQLAAKITGQPQEDKARSRFSLFRSFVS